MPSRSRPVPLERCGRDRPARDGRGRQDALLLRQLPCPAATPARPRPLAPAGLHGRYHGQFAYFGGSGTSLIGNMAIDPQGGMFVYGNGTGPIDYPSLQAISFPLSS